MPYTKVPITRASPGCIVFLLDQSTSMGGHFGGNFEETAQSLKKSEGLAQVVNRFLQSLIIRCTRDEAIYDYFDVGLFGYSTGGGAKPLLSGPLAGKDLAPISQVASNPLRIEERLVSSGGSEPVKQKAPMWVEPEAHGGTPMCAALDTLHGVLSQWIADHPDTFPPMAIHVTDGGSTDGDPIRHAEQVRNLSTNDGEVLLFNCHISSSPSRPVLFPGSPGILQDKVAQMLFNMSSDLPEPFLAGAQSSFPDVRAGSRGFAFNAGVIELIQFIDMGTRASNSLR